MSEEIELPPLPASQMNVEVWDSEVRGLHGANAPYYTADQMQAYARQAVLEERERLLGALFDQSEPVAEFLYGHPREKAIEWAKLDKFESEYDKAREIIDLLASALRRG